MQILDIKIKKKTLLACGDTGKGRKKRLCLCLTSEYSPMETQARAKMQIFMIKLRKKP
jgi:hypothetical protein